jgi:endonuclease-3
MTDSRQSDTLAKRERAWSLFDLRLDMKQARLAFKELSLLKTLSKPMRLAAEGWPKEWQTLVAIILSARTRDETAIRVAEALFVRFKTPAALAAASPGEAEHIIRPVNFFRNKTKNILGAAKALVGRFDGKVPHSREELITVPGVGRKTANVFLSEYGADAIGVDTHVSYISRKLGWTRHHDPRKIEKDLERLFPRRLWSRVNRVCVRFGKTHTSRKRKNELLASLLQL